MKASKTLIAVAVAALIPLGAAVAGDNDQYGSKDKSMSETNFKKLPIDSVPPTVASTNIPAAMMLSSPSAPR